MTFSVVIPTCHRPALLRACLEKLAPQIHDVPGRPDIVVTDDSHSDDTARMLGDEFPHVRWTQGPRRGPAANRNHGAFLATGEWLVFLDDDCLPSPTLLSTYWHASEGAPEISVFEGKIVPDREKRHPLEECPVNDRGGNLWSCNFAIRRALFVEMGGFDESFPHAAGEDWEFRYRLQKADVPIHFVPEAVVTHPWRRRTWRGHWEQHHRLLEASVRVLELHPELRMTWRPSNVGKDIIRYYVKVFPRDLLQCGLPAVFYQPLFLAVQWRRWVRYLAAANQSTN